MKNDKETVIKLENVSKTFFLNEDRKFTLRSLVSSFFKQGKTRKFKAVNNVNLEIKKGEFIGIIGRNGSGKSTLLKLIAGIYHPDKGSKIEVNGSLVPFLELGVGFNHELTGKENVYLNGTILGMSKSYIDSKYNEIVEFSELKEFMDVPVKNYSSGMMVRLAFSIAIQTDGDIYILDEILAVGDEIFQQKSVRVINEFVEKKKTILFVTHDSNAIKKFCTKGLLMDKGELIFFGDTKTMIDKYHDKYPPDLYAK